VFVQWKLKLVLLAPWIQKQLCKDRDVLSFKVLITFVFVQVSQLTEYQSRIHLEIRRTQKLQWLSMIVTLLVGVALVYIFIQESQDFSGHMCFPEERFHTSNI